MDPQVEHPPADASEINVEPRQREEHEQQQQRQQPPQSPHESSGSRGSQPAPAQGDPSLVPPPLPAKPVLRLPEFHHPTARIVPNYPSNMSLGHPDRPEGEILTAFGPQRGEVPFSVEPRVSRYPTQRTAGSERVYNKSRTGDPARRSTIDWVVPVEERPVQRRTVEERLRPTIKHALRQGNKLKRKARITKWVINVIVGIQVLLGGLTTGIAAARLDGKQLGIATAILGILTTLSSSFLARLRSVEEPETSIVRAHEIDSFMRRCEAFCLDSGHETGERINEQVENFRHQFESLLVKNPPLLPTANKPEDKPKEAAAV
ncbi:hypothetical protein AX15_000557 [Amanita polypyramis BW_CC]|nr:hypothetical protein AX15_000557 [Amanita polypyramis BW_CC]